MAEKFDYLKTHEFNRVLSDYVKYSKDFEDIRRSVDAISLTLLESWRGKGSVAFDKNFRQVQMNLKDIAGIMYDMHHDLRDAYAEYMKTDEATAKRFDSQ